MNVADAVKKYAPAIYRRAFRYYDDTDNAYDLASETIFRCLAAAASYSDNYHFLTWSDRIMRNIYITEYNRRKLAAFAPFEGYEESSDYDLESGVDAAMVIDAAEELRKQSACVDALMMYVSGYTYHEIAKINGLSINTVKSRIRIGREMLKKALSGQSSVSKR